MTNKISREIRLKNRPVGLPGESDFELAEVAVPEVGDARSKYLHVGRSVYAGPHE